MTPIHNQPFPLTMPLTPWATPTSECFGFPHQRPAAIPVGTLPSFLGLLTWSHCASSPGPPCSVRLPTLRGPPTGLGLYCPGRTGRRGEGRGRKGKGRAVCSFWHHLKMTGACSLSPQSTIFYSMFTVLRRLGVEGGIQRGMENMCSKKGRFKLKR